VDIHARHAAGDLQDAGALHLVSWHRRDRRRTRVVRIFARKRSAPAVSHLAYHSLPLARVGRACECRSDPQSWLTPPVPPVAEPPVALVPPIPLPPVEDTLPPLRRAAGSRATGRVHASGRPSPDEARLRSKSRRSRSLLRLQFRLPKTRDPSPSHRSRSRLGCAAARRKRAGRRQRTARAAGCRETSGSAGGHAASRAGNAANPCPPAVPPPASESAEPPERLHAPAESAPATIARTMPALMIVGD